MLVKPVPTWAPIAGRVLVVIGCVAAVLVVLAAVQHGSTAANDFQWSGARLLLSGRDPYQALFDGDASAFRMTQFPNYAPLLYVLLVPLAGLSLAAAQPVWAVLNLGMLLAAVLLVAEGVGLSGWKRLGLVAAVFLAEPFCITLGSGQQTALALFTAVLAVRATGDVAAGTGLGVMLVKYSFAPVALVALAKKRWAALGAAAAIEAAGLVIFCLITRSSLLSTCFAPLRAADMTQARGSGDVLTLTRLLTGNEAVAFGLAVAAGTVLAWYAWPVLGGASWVDALAGGALISLLVFPHLVYDNCFLLPVLGSAILRRGGARAALLAVVGLLWYDWLLPHRVMTPYLLPGVIVTLVLQVLALGVLVRSAERSPAATEESLQTESDLIRSALA